MGSTASAQTVLKAPLELPKPGDPDFATARQLVNDAVAKGIPGAVLLVGYQGRAVVRRAYGIAVRPLAGTTSQGQPMTLDTEFDMASLTKPIATSTAVMLLVEAGKIDLDAPVSRYLPVFATKPEKAAITIRNLLTHTAGFPAGGAYAGKTRSFAQMMDDVVAAPQKSPVGTAFLYSDYSFITLGAVVEAVTGQTLDQFCTTNIFVPLGMRDTYFQRNQAPIPFDKQGHIAATSALTPGIVHDPSARALDGVGGNAGLFATADDLARFATMILNGGELNGVRLLKPETVKLWTTNQSPALPGERALGWDIDSAYQVRGSLSPGSFGHTGFTGTSIWIDPTRQTFVILLTNAVYAQPSIVATPLRRAVAQAVGDALPATVSTP